MTPLTSIKSNEDISSWLEYFYQHPQPDLFPEVVQLYSDKGMFKDFNVVHLASLDMEHGPQEQRSTAVFIASQIFKKVSSKDTGMDEWILSIT